ncbi:conserved hypothetical protein [Talaromyces stipitatus ATCC 10500]|uniref:Phosphatidylethanolamine-binding protein n=1 Tax=Talaromyces stipitatus (strain ATCC 10500 / CBS 375.48 / QM 6759 / NRRL 1006) TaxID=441959 RepID=B8MP00_TALSN|nr:uncharacterized protein TSTA_104540 [Talaromyces stipitatus ATCC 10500]EED14239.1 conserved hypothetical protein [Talaromyces stipitatus ATCC 10500]
MVSQSDVTSALTADGIIPDILPTGTTVPRNLKISFHTTTLDKPGQMIDRDDTQVKKPTVFVDPPLEGDRGDNYTLLMVDPDLTIRHDTRFGQVRHWLISHCSISPAGEVLDVKGVTHSPYVGPAPMPVFDITGKPHPSRYTFILFKPKSSLTKSDDVKISQSEQYPGLASDLGKPSQDLFDRWKFSTKQFMEENNLEVVAATYMLVEGNLKSSVANAGLMANAIGHKIGEIGH